MAPHHRWARLLLLRLALCPRIGAGANQFSCLGDTAGCGALSSLWAATTSSGNTWWTATGWSAAAQGTPVPLCTGFLGVTCNGQGKVSRVELAANGLLGPLPDTFLTPLCATLQVLNLSHNLLTGPAPASLANCTGLTTLALGNTTFSGGLLQAVAPLPALRVLDLHTAFLTGPLSQLASAGLLTQLDLSDNLLSSAPAASLTGGVCTFACGWQSAFTCPAANLTATCRSTATCGTPSCTYNVCSVQGLTAAAFPSTAANCVSTATGVGCGQCLPAIIVDLVNAGVTINTDIEACIRQYTPQLLLAGAAAINLQQFASCGPSQGYSSAATQAASCPVSLTASQIAPMAAACASPTKGCSTCPLAWLQILQAAGVLPSWKDVNAINRTEFDIAQSCLEFYVPLILASGAQPAALALLFTCPVPPAPVTLTATVYALGLSALAVPSIGMRAAVQVTVGVRNLADITLLSITNGPAAGSCLIQMRIGASNTLILQGIYADMQAAAQNGSLLTQIHANGMEATNVSVVAIAYDPAAVAPATSSPSTVQRDTIIGAVLGTVLGCAAVSGIIAAVASRHKRQQQAAQKRKAAENVTPPADRSGIIIDVGDDEASASRGVGAWRAQLIEESELQVGELLGKGSFAHVFSARWRGTAVAIKRFEPVGLLLGAANAIPRGGTNRTEDWWIDNSGELDAHLTRELSLLASLRHPHIVAVYGVVQRPGTLVMELAAGGSLSSLLARADLNSLPWTKRRVILTGVASGVEFLHSCKPPVIHLDLKSANIVLSLPPELSPKVTDFGLSMFKHFGRDGAGDSVSAPGGTLKYMAPEVVRGEAITKWEAIDCWGFGCIANDCATLIRRQSNPKDPASTITTYAGVATPPGSSIASSASSPALPFGQQPLVDSMPLPGAGAPRLLIDLIAACMAPRPGDRLSMQAARQRLEEGDDEGWTSSGQTSDESQDSQTALLS